jgi:hypothetical protein
LARSARFTTGWPATSPTSSRTPTNASNRPADRHRDSDSRRRTPAAATDYRPISLLNTIAKLIEQIIFERIKPRLEGPDQLHAMSNDLYAPISPLEQAGFTTGRSTIQQALLTRLAREHAARNHTDLYITGYDQAKAFDSAQWIEIVLSMAQSKRWHWRECSFALAWMTGQTRRLLVNGTLSEPITVTRGVPQGGILSPTLYNEHVRTLATKINSLSLVNPAPITKRVNITDTSNSPSSSTPTTSTR